MLSILARMDSRLVGFAVLSLATLSGCGRSGDSPLNEMHRTYACGLQAPLASFASTFAAHGKLALGTTTEFSVGSELTLSLKERCTSPAGSLSELVAPNDSGATPAGVRAHTIRLTRAMTSSELAQVAEADPCVVSVSPVVRAHVSDDGSSYLADPYVSSQAHLATLGAAEAYGLAFTGAQAVSLVKPVVIAVIDTGIDLQHEDLKNVLWVNAKEIPSNQIDDDHNGYVDDVNGWNFPLNSPNPQYIAGLYESQHGTHVSGLAAAQGGNGVGGSGVMGAGVRIMPLNVFASSSGAEVSDIANAIRFAADNGADVINLSLGGYGESEEYKSALIYAIDHGVTVLTAAGNEHAELGPAHFLSPAAYASELNGMLAIGSVDTSSEQLSTYSNYGLSSVGLAAPGAENSGQGRGLLSTYPNNKYVRIQGTSMSSPVAAGAAAFAIAMYRARGYAPSPATVVGAMQVSARTNANLTRWIAGGRELSLSNLAHYIDSTYVANAGAATDPGVPGWACH